MSGATHTDILWLLVSTILVVLMQAGFACLETGFVRAKNGINVAIKNVTDFYVSSLLFWLVGFGLMFGATTHGWWGTDWYLFDGGDGGQVSKYQLMAFFFFQLAFCSTSTTIVSGAVAERMSFGGYLVVACVLSGLVYPVFGHWAWGGAALGVPEGWLVRLGFIDFAGSTVVHSIGGWMSLAALLILGPRHGRFGRNGRPIAGHDVPLAALGTLFLLIGWFGFNGGSTLRMNDAVPRIVVHTLLAGSAGGLAAMALQWRLEGRPNAGAILNGLLAGLVAITAPCAVVTTANAVLIGAIGGIICVLADHLLTRLKIDDAVGAVPVHLAAGVWGTLAVALLGEADLWGTGHSRWQQLGVQALGVGAAALWGFGISLLALWIINQIKPLRVSPEAEQIGLNISEHGSSSALHELLATMDHQRRTGDFSQPVVIEPGTEAALIAEGYNQVLDRFNLEVWMREKTAAALREAKENAEIASASKSQFLANMSHELRTPLNAIIGFSEIMVAEMFGPVGSERYKEYAGDIHRSSTHLLSLINDILDLSKIEANKLEITAEEINLPLLVEGVLRIIAKRAQEERVRLAVDLDPALFPLSADKRAIKQILLNLLSNAIKFTPEGGRVTLSVLREPDNRIAIVVRDTGVGMKKQDIPKALEPFTQLGGDATVYSAEGTGLGLPLTVALVRLHGGTIVLESEPGQGTTVTVRFPHERTVRRDAAAGVRVADAMAV